MAVSPEILAEDGETDFPGLTDRVKIRNQMVDGSALFFRPGNGDDQFDRQIRAVVQVKVFFQTAVAGGLHSQGADLAGGVQFFAFVDHNALSQS